ncbi:MULTISPECIES: orotidine 5'-phosphate decarboxylase / HUMPS family protein [Clostridium]|uniref:orotidine 5'-phosphate decarboxylase / HUMPS family protein n=1 Tax=Clostridium TaxID=1485 RepID=UPI00069F9878|nr:MULTISPECIES: orotidine 5'-phosphate decarboxylase / HUMPS family protein [Clostridium]KOF56583.1 3-hexulose-6-phosphate synthase [Clostridium sp. DMHC 10]MCD2346440.1 orotidine 5'-phosphate decarboxylase [Clostridium guangxiense]
MKIQLALDRITLGKAKSVAKKAEDYVDIIEVGTSLIKDYGKKSVSFIKENFKDKTILADIKTCDEGEYEFKSAFEAGADIATVMGNSPIETIEICYNVSKEYNKDVMIDLMGTSESKIAQLKKFDNAIFFIHLPKDNKHGNLIDNFNKNSDLYRGIKRIALGGSVKEDILKDILLINPEILVVGSAITKSNDIGLAACRFKNNIIG